MLRLVHCDLKLKQAELQSAIQQNAPLHEQSSKHSHGESDVARADLVKREVNQHGQPDQRSERDQEQHRHASAMIDRAAAVAAVFGRGGRATEHCAPVEQFGGV